MGDWKRKGAIRNVLLDINGVLFESGEDEAIAGSVDALSRLVDAGIDFCLVTNECTKPKRRLAETLRSKFGFEQVTAERIISPAPVACRYLIENRLIPRLHVWDELREDFDPLLRELTEEKLRRPNCLVVGDMMSKIGRDSIDESLELMLTCDSEPKIVALGTGRYYKDCGRIRMDTGAYVAAFEYCLGVSAVNLGKPNPEFFLEALAVVGGSPADTVMIGDDVVSDVGGAQLVGNMRAFLVRTGKYRPSDETARGVAPDDVFGDLSHAVDAILSCQAV